MPTDREQTQADSGVDLLTRAAAEECVYVRDGSDWGDCPECWPGHPETWCGSCLSREAIKLGLRTGRIIHGDAE